MIKRIVASFLAAALISTSVDAQVVTRLGPAATGLGSAAASIQCAPTLQTNNLGSLVLPSPLATLAPTVAPAPIAAQAAMSAVAVGVQPAAAAAAQNAAVPQALVPALAAAAATPPNNNDDPTAAKDANDKLFDGAQNPEGPTYEVQFSQPGRIAKIIRKFWPAHTFFRVVNTKTEIDGYLPAKLKAFPQAKPSLLTRIKRSVLFSPPVVALIRSQLAQGFKTLPPSTDKEIWEKLYTHTEANPGKYNIVIEGGIITVARLDHGKKLPDWVLSKHVLISGYSKDVRFAGEMWKAEDGTIYLSNNSGTYRPTEEQLTQAVAYMQAIFPGVTFKAYVATIERGPAEPKAEKKSLLRKIKGLYTDGSDQFKKEVRRKLIHQKNWGYLIGYLLMGWKTTVIAYGVMTAIMFVIGMLRLHYKPFHDWAQKHVSVLRVKENTKLTGTFYGSLGVTIAVALFGWNPLLVAAGVLAYTVGDAASPLIGLRFGWKPFTVNGTKRSVDGALASFTLVLAMNLLLGFPLWIALIGALAFSAVDIYPVKPDDNFWIPIAVPSALYLASLLLR